MKKIILMLSLMFSSVSQATLIEIDFDQDSYGVNETAYGRLIVSDFDQVLGGFFAELIYQTAGLELVDWQFGAGFDHGTTDEENNTGSLYLAEYSWSFDDVFLADLQGTSFTLASFSFKALSVGQQFLTVNPGNSGLLNIDFDGITPQFSVGSFMVTDNPSTPVPTPASLILLISGLALLINTKRKTLFVKK